MMSWMEWRLQDSEDPLFSRDDDVRLTELGLERTVDQMGKGILSQE